MDRRTSSTQKNLPRNLSAGSGQGSDSCPTATPPGGKALKAGRALAQTIRHFFPELNAWLDQLPETRFKEMIRYIGRFLCWWGLLLFITKLGSRRQLDFQLRDLESYVLANVNLLAQSEQQSLPVNGTLSHYLGHVGARPWADLRTRCARTKATGGVLITRRASGAAASARPQQRPTGT